MATSFRVFAVLAAAAGVCMHAGSSIAVRCRVGPAPLAAWAVATAEAGREYLDPAVAALVMDWAT